MTPFEQAVESVKKGELKAPSVMYGNGTLDYFQYQLSIHYMNLKGMAIGLQFRGIKFTQLKKYYGLKGRSAKDCLPELEKIKNEYKPLK
jgi:hypothetical protein